MPYFDNDSKNYRLYYYLLLISDNLNDKYFMGFYGTQLNWLKELLPRFYVGNSINIGFGSAAVHSIIITNWFEREPKLFQLIGNYDRF